jgi:hypothetical protein
MIPAMLIRAAATAAQAAIHPAFFEGCGSLAGRFADLVGRCLVRVVVSLRVLEGSFS